MRGLSLALVLGLIACSGRSASTPDATPDLPPTSQWTPCPPDVSSASGQPCVGANECDYGGCLPGDWCRCESGMWSCYLSSCSADLGPDLGLDLGPDLGVDLGVDLGAVPDATVLGQGDPCDPGDDHCGGGLKCCVTCCGVPWIFDAAGPPTHTCTAPMSDGTCPPPPP